MQQRDGDALDVLAQQRADRLARRGLVQRSEHAAVRKAPLVGLADALERHQRLGPPVRQLVRQPSRDVGAADLQDVPEALRHDETDPCAAALQHRVGRHGAGEQQPGDVAGVHPDARQQLADPGHQPLRRIRRGRPHLGDVGIPRPVRHHHHVGERPADVDRDADLSTVPRCCDGRPPRWD